MAFRSKRRETTSCRPWKQAKVKAVFRLVSIWALISDPMSKSNFTDAVWPFMAANMRGEMPNLDPVRELISAPVASNSLMMLTYPPEAARAKGV